MACDLRERTGMCRHQQCPHPDQSGYNCIEIAEGYCECGDGCVPECDYSWPESDKSKSFKAWEAFRRRYPEMQ
jgi:hypothetical protein